MSPSTLPGSADTQEARGKLPLPCQFCNSTLESSLKIKQLLPEVPKQESLQVRLFLILIQTNERKLNSQVLLSAPFAGLRGFVLVK